MRISSNRWDKRKIHVSSPKENGGEKQVDCFQIAGVTERQRQET